MNRIRLAVACLATGIGLIQPAWGWEEQFESGLGGWTTNGLSAGALAVSAPHLPQLRGAFP